MCIRDSDDTSKQSNEVSEGVSESKIVENGSHEIKNDNGDAIENVAIESGNNVVDSSEEIINQVSDNSNNDIVESKVLDSDEKMCIRDR